MSVLPSPIPHPFEFSPWELPQWMYEALEWVVGFDWPEGNEVLTWAVADQWHAMATLLQGAAEESNYAASQFVNAYGGSGVTADAFRSSWQQVSNDADDAPLSALLTFCDQMAQMVDGCGCDIESAKIEAWIELGLFVIELIGLAVSMALTLGASSPAAGGVMMATRMAIQQIFKKLIQQLSKKALKQALKEAGERAAKQLTTKAGLKALGRHALKEGLSEAREELLTNGLIQGYQSSAHPGHKDGISAAELGWSTLGGLGGGVGASGARIGAGHHGGGFARGVAANVLGDIGGSAATLSGPNLDDLAHSATSGAVSSHVDGLKHDFKGMRDLSHLKVGDLTPGSLPTTHSPDLPDAFAPSDTPSEHAAAPTESTPQAYAPSHTGTPSHGDTTSYSETPSHHSEAPAHSGTPAQSSTPAAPSHSNPVSDPSPGVRHESPSPPTHSPAPTDAPSPRAPEIRGTELSGASAPPVHHPMHTESSPTPDHGSGPPRTDPVDSGTPVAGGPGNNGAAATGTAGAGPSRWGSPSTVPPGPSPSSGPTPSPNSGPATGFDRPHHPVDGRPNASGPRTDSPKRPRPVDPANDRTRPTPEPIRDRHRPSDLPPRDPMHPGRDDHADHNASRPEGPGTLNPGGQHANPHLTRRDAAESAAEQDYFDNQERNKKRIEFDRVADEKAKADRELRTTQRALHTANAGLVQARAVGDIHGENVYLNKLAQLQIDLQDTWQHRQDLDTPDGMYFELDGQEWKDANNDVGFRSDLPGHSDISALTGGGNPPNHRLTRPYGVKGGLREPLAQHQVDLERVVPQDPSGEYERTPDPRGDYLKLMNDGGPAADPARGVNCVDCALSFYETYVHGRPTVAAPRTYDGYTIGETDVPYGEFDGPDRMEHVLGTTLETFSNPLPGMTPAQTKQHVDQGFVDLGWLLQSGGHGATALIITGWENGFSHAWNAVNHHGRIIFVDPQSGEHVDTAAWHPSSGLFQTLYGHCGYPDGNNVAQILAIVVDGNGNTISNGTPVAAPSLPPPPGPVQHHSAPVQPPPTLSSPPVPPPPGPAPTPVHLQSTPTVGPAAGDRADTGPAAHQPGADPAPAVQPDPPRNKFELALGPGPDEPAPVVDTPAPAPVEQRNKFFDALHSEPEPRKVEPPTVWHALMPEVVAPVETSPVVDGPAVEARAKADYQANGWQVRRGVDDVVRERLADGLRAEAAVKLAHMDELEHHMREAYLRDEDARGDAFKDDIRRAEVEIDELTDRARDIENGARDIGDVALSDAEWDRANQDLGILAVGGVDSGAGSALTGSDWPPSVDHSRRYNVHGGLRPPLEIHQVELERAMPRDEHGAAVAHADPRDGEWFGLLNDGGPEADPMRSINTGDTMLSLYDAYMHGRPRVSAPRTFDGYLDGDPQRPLGAEAGINERIEATVHGRFDGVEDASGLVPFDSRIAMHNAEGRVRDHLLGLGHGAFAFVNTQDRAGRTHTYGVVNHDGKILYLDPSLRTVAERPMWSNGGLGAGSDVVRMDALTMDGQAGFRPMTFFDGVLPFVQAES